MGSFDHPVRGETGLNVAGGAPAVQISGHTALDDTSAPAGQAQHDRTMDPLTGGADAVQLGWNIDSTIDRISGTSAHEAPGAAEQWSGSWNPLESAGSWPGDRAYDVSQILSDERVKTNVASI